VIATSSKVKVRPNTIVQYKGGGYDGCIWEFNYAYVDSQRRFHCIVASGSRGCTTRSRTPSASGSSTGGEVPDPDALRHNPVRWTGGATPARSGHA
jgi:hypothetical protein